MNLWTALISTACALAGTLAGLFTALRREAAERAAIKSQLQALTALGEELRQEQRRQGALLMDLAQRLAREEEAMSQAQRQMDRIWN